MIPTPKPTPTKIVIFYICNEHRRLYEAFIAMNNECKRVSPSAVCVRAGFPKNYLQKENLKSSTWKKELAYLCNASLATWEIDGNGLLQRGKEILKDIKKKGKRPITLSISMDLGYHCSYLSKYNGRHLWVKKLTTLINKS